MQNATDPTALGKRIEELITEYTRPKEEAAPSAPGNVDPYDDEDIVELRSHGRKNVQKIDEEQEKIEAEIDHYVRNQVTPLRYGAYSPSRLRTPTTPPSPLPAEINDHSASQVKIDRPEVIEADRLALSTLYDADRSDPRVQQGIENLRTKEQMQQQASGKSGGCGLYDDQLENVMKEYNSKGFKGVYAIDEISQIPISNKISVILNLDKSSQPGSYWVYIDADGDKSVEYYDSYGEDPPESLLRDIKTVVDKINPDTYLKFKINKIKQQSDSSDTGGIIQ